MRPAARLLMRATLVVFAVVAGAECGDAALRHADRVADEATSYVIQRLALDSLFNGRERAQSLVIWATDAGDGPALEALGSRLEKPAVPRTIDLDRLAPSLPARVVTEAELSELFRRNADAWAAFFRDNPGTPGVVELSPVWLSADGRVARTTVGRSCGEHCRNIWQVTVKRPADGRWRIDDLHWVAAPAA